MRNEQRYCRQSQKYVWTQDLRRSKRKTTKFRETWCKYLYMVLWYGRSCKEVCGAIPRAGQQNNSAALQSRNSMPWWPLIQSSRIGVCCQKYARKLYWNVCLRDALVDQTFYGLSTNLHEHSQNGPELVTNAWLVWFLIYTTRVIFSL